MSEDEFLELKAKIIAAKETIRVHEDELLKAAVQRGEAWMLDTWFYHVRQVWPFLTLEEALDRAQDDCSPVAIIAPDGTKHDPYTGEPINETKENE